MGRGRATSLVGVLALLLCAGVALDARAQWQWQQLVLPTSTPTPRSDAAVAWDPIEARALLFGGRDGTGLRNDLWLWDPETRAWGEIVPQTGAPWPAPRAAARMVFDSLRDVFWIFGGESGVGGPTGRFDELWRFDPAIRAWSRIPPPIGAPWPTARSGQVMVWARTRDTVLIQGGNDGSAMLSDVWEWNGTTFTELSWAGTGDPPPAQTRHVAWWEQASSKLLVFGGEGSGGASDQMSAFDPATRRWQLVPVVSRPVAREDAAAVVVAAETLLVGGRDASGVLLDDLWSWDQGLQRWSELTLGLASRPPPRCGMGAVLSSGTSLHTLTGLVDEGGGAAPSDSVLTWDWASGAPVYSVPLPMPWGPSARRDASLAHDAALGRFLLFGGESAFGLVPARVWLLGVNPPDAVWSDLPVRSISVPARTEATMVALESSDRILLFGGRPSSGNTGMADTWVWEGATRTFQEVAIGTGPPGRFAAAMAYEQSAEDAILFGGEAAGAPAQDTWRFLSGASTWMQVFPTQLPPARRDAVMATLPGAGTFLFGGLGSKGDLFDGWILSSCDCEWLPAPMTITPAGPVSGSMALSVWHHEIVYFGGETTTPLAAFNRTYTYDLLDWTRRLPAVVPVARVGPAMASGPGGVLLFGGRSGTFRGDLWWAFAPTPDPEALEARGPPWATPVCPPRPLQVEIEVIDAKGREVLDPAKNAVSLVLSTTLDPANQIIASDLASATTLPAATQSGQLVGGRATFTLQATVPGSGELIATAASLASPTVVLPLTLLPGPVDAGVSVITASPDPAVAGGEQVVVILTPRDACGNDLGPGRIVFFQSDVGTMGPTSDLGDGRYQAQLTTAAVDCAAGSAQISTMVEDFPGAPLRVTLICSSTTVDPASPVTSPMQARACARKGIFAEVVVSPRDDRGRPLPSGRVVRIDEDPPFLIAGQVREAAGPAGETIYRLEVGSERCASAPVSVPIRVDGVLLSTVPQIFFACEAVDPATVALFETPLPVPADGATPVELRVVARDICGNPAFARPAALEAFGPEHALAVKPLDAKTADRVGDPLDGVVSFDVCSAEAGTFDLRATVDGRSAILKNAVTFLESGGLSFRYQSPVARGVPGQVVELSLSITNGYDVALEDVEIRPVSSGLQVVGARGAVDLGEGVFGLGGLPVGSTATLGLSVLLEPGHAVARSRVEARFRLESNGLAGRGRSAPLSIALQTGATGGCECTSGSGPARLPGGAGLAFVAWIVSLGLVARRRRYFA